MRPIHLIRLAFRLAVRLTVLGLALLATAIIAPGCNTDDVGPESRLVGGRCATNSDCIHRCVTGAEFPGGYCTVSCTNSNNCPSGSACVASNEGICLATCQVVEHCKGYGPDYQCDLLSSQAGGTGSQVCVGS